MKFGKMMHLHPWTLPANKISEFQKIQDDSREKEKIAISEKPLYRALTLLVGPGPD